MDKKYELVKEDSIEFYDRTLYRIRALKDFVLINDVTMHKGDFGGYVQSEENLSQEGNCWVSGDACVYGDARVYDNARVFGDACVYGNAWVYGEAMVSGHARVFENANVYGNAWVYNDAKVRSNAKVGNNANICNSADYICIKGLGTGYSTTTFYKCKDNHIGVTCGCFEGTLDEFVSKVEINKDNKFGKEYLAVVEAVKIHFGLD